MISSKIKKLNVFLASLALAPTVSAQSETISLGFTPPTVTDILSFAVKIFFTIAALTALLFLLTGALQWITSGGNKESVDKARERIQQAIIGLVIIIGVVALAVTFEQFVFKQQICFGFTCPIKIPSLIQSQ